MLTNAFWRVDQNLASCFFWRLGIWRVGFFGELVFWRVDYNPIKMLSHVKLLPVDLHLCINMAVGCCLYIDWIIEIAMLFYLDVYHFSILQIAYLQIAYDFKIIHCNFIMGLLKVMAACEKTDTLIQLILMYECSFVKMRRHIGFFHIIIDMDRQNVFLGSHFWRSTFGTLIFLIFIFMNVRGGCSNVLSTNSKLLSI